MKRLELLAPARDYASAVAAVDAGADAIYIGGARFGARHAAANSVDDIRRAAEYAHLYGVRVHATLNTLLYDDELAAAERQARELVAAGVDALIVQDMALRRMSLPVELHASTQTAIRTPAEAAFLGNAGFARVILERALSLDEIRAICRATTAEVECFVHGAICVGYSGQCYLSRSMSARSGNRPLEVFLDTQAALDWGKEQAEKAAFEQETPAEVYTLEEVRQLLQLVRLSHR